jgi:putative transposase
MHAPPNPGLTGGYAQRTELLLDAHEQPIWTRGRDGASDPSGLVPQRPEVAVNLHRVHERLAAAGVTPSVGTVGDALDNALAETHTRLSQDPVDPPPGVLEGARPR